MTPMAVEDPSVLLTLLTAIFRATAPTAFGKLPCPLLPLAASVIRTLADPAASIIFAAEIPHHDTSPVLHVLGMVAYRELFNKRENIEIIGEQVFFAFRLVHSEGFAVWSVVKHLQVETNLELGYQVRFLKISSEVTVFGNVSEKL